jgi:outer membrane murein-binding lipoprotein Lpp
MKSRHFIVVILIVCSILLLAGCASRAKAGKKPASRNRRAENLLQRAQEELKANEFTSAVTHLLQAERLADDEELRLSIVSLKLDTYNNILIQTGIEDGTTLKYSLLYKREDVFYPIVNMPIGFTFLRGNGIMPDTARTGPTGTALARIEKITSLQRKLIIESVPMVTIENEKLRIEELKYNFVLANRGSETEILLESVRGAAERLSDVLNDIFNEIFTGPRHHMR